MIAKAKNKSIFDKPTNYKKYIIIGGALLIAIILFFMYIAFERYQLYRAEKTIDSIANELSIALPDLSQPNKEKYCTYPSTKMPTIGRKPICTVSATYSLKDINYDNLINKINNSVTSNKNISISKKLSDKTTLADPEQQSIDFYIKNSFNNNCYISIVYTDKYQHSKDGLRVSCSSETFLEYFNVK